MNADAEIASRYSSSDRPVEADAARWLVCFAVIVAIHGGVALALVERISEPPDESGVDGPVVMLDLPPSLVPAIAPPQDLLPGPMQLNEVEETPPPKEETKPPEPEADVALPTPEPPKQEKPPAEKIEATAPVAARTPPPSVKRWQSQLAAHIEHYKRYPQVARTRGEVGSATVSFTIDREGHLLRSSIVQSSGSAALDQETLTMLARAQPMPRPPDQMTDGELTFVMPVRFNIK